MFSQLAQVFSSQGVVLQGSEPIPVYKKKAAPEAPCDHQGNCSCFAPRFEQASAKLELSKQAKSRMESDKIARDSQGGVAASGTEGGAQSAGPDKSAGPEKADGKPLSDEERKQIHELERRDREVKAHEAAHKASAGGNARGGASYEYQTGPDGSRYAVGGHVDIDVSPVQGNPRATLEKARTVQRAALAPADPSGQDRAVAAAAAQMALQAQSEVASESAMGGSTRSGESGATREPGEHGEEKAAQGFDSRNAYGRQASGKGASISIYA
ncbi:MAG: putative metalloprotease CJM1_0395 family protein [Fibrobacteria bacterium]